MNSPFTFVCPRHRDQDLTVHGQALSCPVCGQAASLNPLPDFLGEELEQAQTADHYTLQWSPELGLPARLQQSKAQKFTAAATLPWEEFFNRLRSEANRRQVFVYDAACGWGSILNSLLAPPAPAGLYYLGADIHNALPQAPIPEGLKPGQANLVRWDVTSPLPVKEKFDYVICRSAVMITPSPKDTIATLCQSLKPGGSLAVSIYTKKSPMREASDDALRARIVPMNHHDAMEASRQLASLGRDLRAVEAKVEITGDLPVLGIKAGAYGVQELIYNHFLKCWYNEEYGLEHSALVNFDWYHPQYTHRYTMEECRGMLEDAGLGIKQAVSSAYQHFLEGVKQN